MSQRHAMKPWAAPDGGLTYSAAPKAECRIRAVAAHAPVPVIRSAKADTKVERRSIDVVPHAERHGAAFSQSTLWLGANLQITAVATVAPAVYRMLQFLLPALLADYTLLTERRSWNSYDLTRNEEYQSAQEHFRRGSIGSGARRSGGLRSHGSRGAQPARLRKRVLLRLGRERQQDAAHGRKLERTSGFRQGVQQRIQLPRRGSRRPDLLVRR